MSDDLKPIDALEPERIADEASQVTAPGNPSSESPQPVKHKRPYGLAKGLITISDDFDDPLPEEIIRLFEGDCD